MRSNLARKLLTLATITGFSSGLGLVSFQPLSAQESPGFYTDPATGIVYRQIMRTIEKPVVETKIEQRQQTVYKPKTVTETRPTTRRMYIPVTQNRWVPKVENRWNPFVAPRVAYHHVPETTWQVRDEVIAETKTHVQWEPETQTVSVPQQSLRMDRQQQVDFEPVGRVAPNAMPQTLGPAAAGSVPNVPPEIAARLRPLAANSPIQPIRSGTSIGGVSSVASLASGESPRSSLQTGLRATELVPRSVPSYVAPVDATGIAGLPPMRIWR
ncbi:hypothetical protein [Neorhodopirellula pilleata]|uniref:Uncharacterized protein n=1 Tax=Neorhodopirellula pilleata TaxID=2714738 RepID=A0A5C6ASR9_9BACT|nr:hypothetical protein [Neorhodopirellula pilleata]TWU02032.1 hypothetical protein Pla100_17680 [Neorhodopirellula pilleata]